MARHKRAVARNMTCVPALVESGVAGEKIVRKRVYLEELWHYSNEFQH